MGAWRWPGLLVVCVVLLLSADGNALAHPWRHRLSTGGGLEGGGGCLDRRRWIEAMTLWTTVGIASAAVAAAEEEEGGAILLPTAPKVTRKVQVDVAVQMSAEETARRRLVLGLYGDEAPTATSAFSQLAAGQLEAPCATDGSEGELFQRGALTKKSVGRACLAEEAKPVSYSGSQVWRIVKGKRVDFGQVQGKFAQRVPPISPPSEARGLQHDASGLLSVPKSGGAFDFTVTLGPVPELDDTNKVIGRVLEGMDTLEFLADVPVVSFSGQGEGMATSRQKQCFYGSSDTYCSQLKPIKKILIQTSLVEVP